MKYRTFELSSHCGNLCRYVSLVQVQVDKKGKRDIIKGVESTEVKQIGSLQGRRRVFQSSPS